VPQTRPLAKFGARIARSRIVLALTKFPSYRFTATRQYSAPQDNTTHKRWKIRIEKMENVKYAILGCGVLGLLGIFLPMVSMGGASISLWEVRAFDAGQVYLVLAGFLAPAVMGAMALKGGLLRWQAGVAIAGFGLCVLKLRPWGDVFGGAIGAKLMILGAFLGLAAAIAAIAKPSN